MSLDFCLGTQPVQWLKPGQAFKEPRDEVSSHGDLQGLLSGGLGLKETKG